MPTPPAERFRCGFLLFPRLTQLDFTGPYEALARAPGAEPLLIAKTLEPVRSEHGLTITPTTTFADAPALDLLLVPGGPGVNALLEDAETLGFVRRAAHEARYVTAVCTGSLVLGAAGLLKGKRASTHWASRRFLPAFGATPSEARVTIDGNLVTGGGVTAGIDLGLTVLAEAFGETTAREVQLMMEYAPEPPLDAGRPETAGDAAVVAVLERWKESLAARERLLAGRER